MLGKHVLARDAEIGSAVLHVCRCIGRAHHDHAHVAALGRDHQLARALRILLRTNARALEQRRGLLEDAALRQRDADRAHDPQCILRMSAPSAASFCSSDS
jgi:hypothetical protein